jgi:hypothetical protein
MPLRLIVSLVVLGGLVLLGSLVLLVVCSGMNNLSDDDAPRPGVDRASRSGYPWQRLPKN